MTGTKKEVEKVPKKKVPRTEKGKTVNLFRSFIMILLISYEKIPIKRDPRTETSFHTWADLGS